MIKRIGLFCGAHVGHNPKHLEAARQLGCLMGNQQRALIYGGSCCGFMGVVAGEMLDRNCKVIGVIPSFFKDYPFEVVEKRPLAQLVFVSSMGARKKVLSSRSDAFIALPGGVGTLDEVTEMLVNNQLGFGHKPVAFLNVDGFFDAFLSQLRLMHEEGYITDENYSTIISAPTPEQLLEQIDEFASNR